MIEQPLDYGTSKKRDFALVVKLLWESVDNVFWPETTVKEQICQALLAIVERHFLEHFPNFALCC